MMLTVCVVNIQLWQGSERVEREVSERKVAAESGNLHRVNNLMMILSQRHVNVFTVLIHKLTPKVL